jgi:O-antigen/teichoic acid export membrane protein
MAISTFFDRQKAKVTDNRRVLGSVAALFGGNISASLLGALGGLLVARFLGPEETGRYRVFTIPLMYLTFLHLGTFDGLWRQIPFYTGKNMPEKVEELASAAGAWNVLISSLASLAFFICAVIALVRHDYFSVAGWLSQMIYCWSVYYGGYLSATYRTINQFVAMAKIQLTQAVLNFGLVFIVPLTGFFGLCIRAAVPFMASVGLYHRNRPLKISYRLDWKALGEVVRVGLPFSVWGSLYTSIWAATESALMFSLGGLKGLGLFAVASVIRDGMIVLPQSVYQVMTPRVVEAYAREGSVRRANARSLLVTAGLTGTMVVIVLICSYLLGVLVPLAIPKYAAGIPLMKVCLWFSVLQAASLPFNTLFATGRSWLYGRSVIVGLIVFPLSAYLLTPALGGILAVALGSLIGRTARTLVAYMEIAVLTRSEAP